MAEAARTIHLFHHTLARGGGMERYAETLVTAFRSLGHPVVFHAHQIDAAQAKAWNVQPAEAPIRKIPRKLRDYRFFQAVKRDCEAARDDRLEIALWRVPVRGLMVCGGTHRGYLQKAGRRMGFFDWVQIGLEGKAYLSARRIISHSPLCTRELVELYKIPGAKIAMLYPPVDGRFKHPPSAGWSQEERRRLNLPEDRVLFLFPSTGHRRKGLEMISEALEPLAGQALLLVAGSPPSGKTARHLKFLGYLEEMTAAYHAADFTILGSYYEPFGLVGPESLLCGTRLVFEKNIGCLTAVNPGFVTTFDVRNPASIREAIKDAIALARKGEHRFGKQERTLNYDPSPALHAQELLRLALE